MDTKKISAIRPYFGYLFFAALFLVVHYTLEFNFFDRWSNYRPFLHKLTLSLSIILIIQLIGKLIQDLIHRRSSTEGDRHNLQSIARLVTTILTLIVSIAFLFQNLYAIAVSFGLISLVLGFALQAPIASFIAWLYIIFRKPYKVGDRIQLEGFRGDVLEVNYLDTALLECRGDYLQNDRRSGRIVYFPNSVILKSEVINYTGPMAPFVWNETPLQVAYSSNLQFVEETLIKVASDDFLNQYPEYATNNAVLNDWKPQVYFKTNSFAWLEAVISYPVVPTETTDKRNRILKTALLALQEHPEKAQFPEGRAR